MTTLEKFEFNDRDYYRLPHGSYHNWIEVGWWMRYRDILSFREGIWIPRMDKLKELAEVDREYHAHQEAIYQMEQREKGKLSLDKV